VIALGVALLAGLGALVLTFENASFAHSGRVPFSFAYRDLFRTQPDAGGYVRVVRRRADGRLRDSLAVEPLVLPPYTGELSAELPLYAERYIRELGRRHEGFALRGEGKAKINGMISAYDVLYTTIVAGRRLFGRDVLLLPERPGAREGVTIVMLTTPVRGSAPYTPLEVGESGILLRPLKSFSFG
jgi:hypothetical protein